MKLTITASFNLKFAQLHVQLLMLLQV